MLKQRERVRQWKICREQKRQLNGAPKRERFRERETGWRTYIILVIT